LTILDKVTIQAARGIGFLFGKGFTWIGPFRHREDTHPVETIRNIHGYQLENTDVSAI
jgi:hypothetical protein